MKNTFFYSFSFLLILGIAGWLTQHDNEAAPRAASLPCQFSWEEVYLPNGNTVNYTEERICQPYQGPCVAFSLIKAMETRLNRQTSNACRNDDYSFAYLDYAAYFSPQVYFDLLNDGFGTPEEGCGNFPPECNVYAQDDYCWCIDNLIQDQAIDNDLCFDVSLLNLPPEEYPDPTCADHWAINTSPITSSRIFANNVYELSPANVSVIKQRIIGEGPVVAIIESEILNQYRNYGNVSSLNFHSFAIIGWEDGPDNTTIWKVDDHWPGNAALCGTGLTNAISNSTLLQHISNHQLSLHGIGSVYTDANCSGNPTTFYYSDQEECPEDGGSVCDPTPPIISDIQYVGGNSCLARWGNNSMKAVINCNNGPEAGEYQWQVSPGGTGLHSTFPCYSYCAIVPSAETVFVKVRARQSSECPWSDWYMEEFCTQGGGGEGPAFNNIPLGN